MRSVTLMTGTWPRIGTSRNAEQAAGLVRHAVLLWLHVWPAPASCQVFHKLPILGRMYARGVPRAHVRLRHDDLLAVSCRLCVPNNPRPHAVRNLAGKHARLS